METTVMVWANPLLTIPELAKMSGKSYKWIKRHIEMSENPIPHYADGSQKRVLWSDFVTWYKSRYAPGSEHYQEFAGVKDF